MPANTILVVDDQDELRLLISLSLQTLGRIVEASNAEQALALFAAERPDVVVLDIWLGPGASGLDVCARLRQDPANAGVKIVLLSACGQQSDVTAGMDAGADLYIVKPFSPFELIDAVTGLLANSPENTVWYFFIEIYVAFRDYSLIHHKIRKNDNFFSIFVSFLLCISRTDGSSSRTGKSIPPNQKFRYLLCACHPWRGPRMLSPNWL